jgi:flavin reductase (DIM6/NTAB) family NADH-FMN oxidoreductase RutF
MSRFPKSDISRAMAQMPGGLFVMTAASDGQAGAVLVKWVQPCSDSPPMVMVALTKGQHIEPMLRNSRAFALCQISETDRFLLRKFTQAGATCGPTRALDDDPLVTMTTTLAPSGAPVVERAMTYLDCEIVRHVELESDFRIYVGQVHAGALLHQGIPAVQYGGNGATPLV